MFQEEQNRGKPNWEHLNDELHVLITVEDSENRAQLKLERAVDEVKKLLTVVSKSDIYLIPRDWSQVFLSDNCAQFQPVTSTRVPGWADSQPGECYI